MKTVGAIFKETRLRKNISIEQVEKDTKIRRKFLEAIELDDFTTLPSLAYTKGFVQNYSDYLMLNKNIMLAFFRRQTKETPKNALLPKGVSEHFNKTFFQLTPAKFLAIILLTFILMFLGYLGFQYKKLQQPPVLTVESPDENYHGSQKRIDVFGKTNPDATVTINNVSVIIRDDGTFFDQVALEQGVNSIIITATSRYGKSSTIRRDVTYQP